MSCHNEMGLLEGFRKRVFFALQWNLYNLCPEDDCGQLKMVTNYLKLFQLRCGISVIVLDLGGLRDCFGQQNMLGVMLC